MRINEIEYGHWNKPSLPEKQQFNDSSMIGIFDGYDIHQWKNYILILDEQQRYKGYIRVTPNSNGNLIFNEAYVTEQHRRKGIGSILVLFVLRKLNKKLILAPDEIVTDDSRSLFFQLLKMNKISISNDGQRLSLNDFGKICADSTDNNLELVIEGKQKFNTTCFEIRNPANDLSAVNAEFGRESHRYE